MDVSKYSHTFQFTITLQMDYHKNDDTSTPKTTNMEVNEKMEDETYIQEYRKSRGISKQTTRNIRIVLRHYTKFQQANLHELITEADNEEEERIRWKKRTLKRRLINYQNYLRETMTINSAKYYMKTVKSFYKHNEIEIHNLPPINKANSILTEPISYKDLPDNEIIKEAVEIASPLMKAVILLMSSSGMSKVDVLQLTIQDFIDSISSYIPSQLDLIATIHYLQQVENIDIVPSWKLRRQKTGKYFITFSSHESTIEIVNYLLYRMQKQELHLQDKLFKIHQDYIGVKFQEINDTLHLGKIGHYNRFRGHMLRKFQASNLAKDGMDRYLINVLQGKSNGQVDDVYFFEDENRLREEYLQHMHCLLIFTEVKEVTVHSPEFLELKKENTELKKQLEDIQQMKDEIEKIKEWFILD